jgi:uroporphyrinogen-III synthase
MPLSPELVGRQPGPILVTRPEADARRWVEQFKARGLNAEALPLIDIGAVPDRKPVDAAWRDLAGYAAVMFVSGNAVTHFFSARQAGLPDGPRFMAPGPGTALALQAAGVPADRIDAPAADAAQFDSESLWQVIGGRDWQERKVLIVRGQSAAWPAGRGRDWLASQWEAAGASVDFVHVYQRRAPRFTPSQIARMAAGSHDGSVWLFSSSEALAFLPAMAGVRWSLARAVATHPRIAEAARAAGWGTVHQSRPELDDICLSIESLFP